ncbi:MAG TPA: glycosyltransferase family 39 protein [Myxococcota bacterium]|nr:glycosyltransferase family 39 protein [Myxococcota bacterium]
MTVALAALFAFTGLANHPLQAADEPRVAGIAWEMQHTGEWWVPHLSGEPFLEHPPLFYAVLGGFIRALGASEGVARLPGAIASFLTALLVCSLARRVAGRSAGLPALFALVGIAGFARFSHRVLVDPLLMLTVTAGYYAYVRAVFTDSGDSSDRGGARPSAVWLCAVYVDAALAFWVKGPIGVAAIAGPLAIEALAARRWRVVFSPVHVAGLPLLAAACVAWPLLLEHAGGDAAARVFLLNNGWYRIAPEAGAGQYLGGHERPFWYYLPHVFSQLGWIALFAAAAGAWLWRGAAPTGWRVPALRFLAWVLPIGVILLSIPGTKRGLYLLPFEPPLAVAVGAWIAAAARPDPHRTRLEIAVNTLCARIARVDLGAAAAGACRAPYRVASMAFAIAIAWNAVGMRFVGGDRDLGPMARAVGERAGADPLLLLLPEECVLGAFPFYTGRIPAVSRDADRLAEQIAQRGTRFLLAPLALRNRIATELGSGAVLEEAWSAGDDDYGLFAVHPDVAASLAPAGNSDLMQN